MPRASSLRYTHNKKKTLLYTAECILTCHRRFKFLNFDSNRGFPDSINFPGAEKSSETRELVRNPIRWMATSGSRRRKTIVEKLFLLYQTTMLQTNIRFHFRERTYSVTSIVRLPITIVILFPLIIKYSFWYNRLSTTTNARHLY